MSTLTYIVRNQAELAAAVQAAAVPSYAAAKRTPVLIRLGTTAYTFTEGITERRAKEIVAAIKATTAKAFAL